MPYTTLNHAGVSWINILHPTVQDTEYLVSVYPKIHPLNLQDCLTELEYPKLDHHDDYLFLVVQFPYWDEHERISRPAEIDIFITHGLLVTSHRGELKPLVEAFKMLQSDEQACAEWMRSGASPLLYRLLNALVDYCFPIVYAVDRNLRQIENKLFRENTHRVLNEIAIIRRDIISLRRIINPQVDIVQTLEAGNWPFIHEELDIYWGDIGDHLLVLKSMLEEHAEVVSGLSETIDTLASHRIDEVVSLLTVVTIITLPLTLLATIFGMNIIMPYSEHPLLFYSVVAAGLVLTGLLILYLRKNDWL